MSLPCTRCGLLVGVDQARCPRCGASLAQPSDVTTPVASPGTRSSTQVLRRVLIGGVAGLIALGLAFTAYAMLNRTDPASRAAASNAAVDPATGPSASAQPPTPTPTPTKAPFAGASLLTATVPAYCQLPETRLVDGRVPASIAGDGNGTLILEGPAAPVFLDLDGDKDPETVAAYSCEASGVAAGAHWPEMLVIYGADGAIKGTVGLGDHKLVGDTTTLEALAVSGNGVQVEWLDNNRLGTTMGRTGTLTWAAGAPDLSANAIGTTVTVVAVRRPSCHRPATSCVTSVSNTSSALCSSTIGWPRRRRLAACAKSSTTGTTSSWRLQVPRSTHALVGSSACRHGSTINRRASTEDRRGSSRARTRS